MHTMKILSLVLFIACASVQAQAPTSLSYQGYLTHQDNLPVDGTVLVTFSVYASDIGDAPLWSDQQLVTVDHGLFSVELGGPGRPFPDGLFDIPLWLGVSAGSDAEMHPRRALTSVGFAFKAENALSLQGRSPAAFDQSTHVNDQTNPHSIDAEQIGAVSADDIAFLRSELATALTVIAALQSDLANETAARIAADNTEQAERILAIEAETIARNVADSQLDAAIAGIQSNTVLELDGVLSLPNAKTALFNGVNVQVVNGTGTTGGEPNGRGNLIVGYDTDVVVSADSFFCSLGGSRYTQDRCLNEGGKWRQSLKGGSHNVVVGDNHNYSRFGGIVVGLNNNIVEDWSSVSGGSDSTASGLFSSIGGGRYNDASGAYASALGGGGDFVGNGNLAYGDYSAILGGQQNYTGFGVGTDTGFAATISGGLANIAQGDGSTVSGGISNFAGARGASVSGGIVNSASGSGSSVSGGFDNRARGDLSSTSGGFSNNATGRYASVSGGERNHATGESTSVSGGFDSNAIGMASSISGGHRNETSGIYSSVSGGSRNNATGSYSSISGGDKNIASGYRASVIGGRENIASGYWTTVAGGGGQNFNDGNVAYAIFSTVTGGRSNTTGDPDSSDPLAGQAATVSGGQDNNAIGSWSSVTGGDNVNCLSDTCGEGAITTPD